MFCDFFALREQPFGVTPDERFLYLSETHREALASLTYRLQAGRGFVGIVAPPGMGKTTLLFRLLQDLRGSARTAFIFQTQCTPIEFLRFLVEELELGADDGDLVHLHQLLKKALLKEQVVIVIDEAQNLSHAVLEQVRLISNFETPRAKLLQIVLSGQTQLATKLSDPDLLQLRQRLSIIRGLQPFSAAHTAQYIEHRLKIAGRSEASLFSRRATEEVARLSGGVPRLINNICFNALSVGFASRLQFIDVAQVREGAADLGLTGPPMRPENGQQSTSGRLPSKVAAPNVQPNDIGKARSGAASAQVINGVRAPVPHTAQGELAQPELKPASVRLQQEKPNVTGSYSRPSAGSSIAKKTGKAKPGARTVVLALAALALLLLGLLDLRFLHRPSPTEPPTIVAANEGVLPPVASSQPLDPTPASVNTDGTDIGQRKPILIYQGVVQEGRSYDHAESASNHNPETKKPTARPPAASQNADSEASLHSRTSPAPPTPHARIESKVLPRYPTSALVNHVGGLVVLDVDVDRHGAIEQVQVIEGNALLSNAAIQAVRLWKFSPATLNGKAVKSLNRVKFTFRPPENG